MDIETLLKNTSRSLYLSVCVLPKTMRGSFAIAYLLCRYADSIADTDLLPQDRRLYWIKQFPTIVEKQNPATFKELEQEVCGQSENPYEKELLKNLGPCLSIFNKIKNPQKQYILDVVHAVCEGMEFDLGSFTQGAQKPTALPTEKELTHYCRLMGGKPGLFWSRLIYHTAKIPLGENDFYELGQNIGDALQIVNILRDLPKDLQIGRCYFPQTDLKENNLSPEGLLSSQNSDRFENIKRKWIFWGVKNLRSGITYFKALPKSQFQQRAAVAWPILWTADTLYKVFHEKDILNSQKRVKISRRIIYLTMLATPLILLSNTLFEKWLNKKLAKFY